MTAIRRILPLFKLRICTLIAFSAVVGLVATSSGGVTPLTLVVLAAATLLASAGASAFNHCFDMDIDSVMSRTKDRPLATGAVASGKLVLVAAAALLAASILISLRLLNQAVAIHLFLGAFFYSFVYTVWLKRRNWTNIIIGGLAGSFAVLAGGASATPELCATPLLLALVMFFWTPSHFWSFAIVHKEDYEKAGVPMLPAVIGEKRTARYTLVNTFLLVGSSLVPAFMGLLGPVYLVAAVAVGAYFILLNVKMVKDPSKEIARRNFKASMLYLGVLFAAVIVDAALR